MKIWLITIGEPLPLNVGVRKMRTAMLADHLIARGHKVRWWTSAFEHQRKVMRFDTDQEVPLSPGLTLQVLRGCGYASNISLWRYLDHRLVAKKFRYAARKLDPPDVIVASMPCHHLAFEVVRYSRMRNVPVLIDIRDLWPDIFLTRITNPLLGRLARQILTFDFQRVHTLLQQADGLVAVSKGYLEWALEKAERAAREWDQVYSLGYQALQQETSHQGDPNLTEWFRDHEGKKLLLFIGTFGFSYELKLLVEAARRMQSSGRTDVCFVLAGTGEQEEMIRRESAGLRNVLLTGWLDAGEITILLRLGYLGLLPYTKIAPQSIPNKPFEYLSAGLPLISSLEGDMAELINDHGLGLNYRPGDLADLCRALAALLDNHDARNKMSANALAFFKEDGDAEIIYAEYARHIENLVEAKSSVKGL